MLDLIDRKAGGILSILTDQSRAPRTTDKTFVEALYKTCQKHPRFVGSALHKGKGQFIISHYAGLVLYDSSGFLDKNKDKTPGEFQEPSVLGLLSTDDCAPQMTFSGRGGVDFA